MKIATAKKKTSKNWVTKDVSWDDLLDRLRTPLRTGETMREYKAMSKDEKGVAKESAGGFVGGELSCGQRKKEFVVNRTLITLDADDAYPGQWDNVTAIHEFTMCCYSTHSSTPKTPRLRWVIPTDRPMTPEEFPAVSRRVAEWIGINTVDPSTHDLPRLMYFPSIPKDAQYEWYEQKGETLSVDEVLRTYGLNADAWKDATQWPIGSSEQEIRNTEAKKAGDPTEKPGIVGLFCRTYDIPAAIDEFLPDVYEQCGDAGRYTYGKGTSFGGARVYQDGAFLYSSHATDPAGNLCCNAFDLVRIHKFGDLDEENEADRDVDVVKRPSYKAMCEWAGGLYEVKRKLVEEQTELAKTSMRDLVAENKDETYSDGDEWESKLTVDKKGKVLPTLNNAILYIRNHPDFKGMFGYNPMNDSITVSRNTPWQWRREMGHKNTLDCIVGTDSTVANDGIWNIDREGGDFLAYFENLGYSAKGASNGMLENALKVVAQENTYHPIKTYLEKLEWDGQKRLDTMFIRWLGAEDDELNRVITRLWMIGAVDRIVRPGCQFDEVLITCGKQGIGKSKMLRILSRGCFTNSLANISMDKKTAELLQNAWIVELGELDSVKKADQTTFKNFITSLKDDYRAAYARQSEEHPRHCIFAGTSNEGSFLRDQTGERRYWVMPVSGIGDDGELRGFEMEVDQIWAETVHEWKNRMRECWEPGQQQKDVNMNLYLKDPVMRAQMESRQAMYKMPDEDREDITEYLETPRPDNWEEMSQYDRRAFFQRDWIGDYDKCTMKINKVCIKEIRFEVFGNHADKNFRIGDILDSTPGWRKVKKRRFKAYGGYPRPAWVRIGSDEDY